MAASAQAAASASWFKTVPGLLGIGMVVAAAAVVTIVLVTGGDDGGSQTDGGTVATLAGGSSTTATTAQDGTTTTGAATSTTDGATATSAATTTTAAPAAYTEEYRIAFMDACREGGNWPFCQCAFREFREGFTPDELTAILDGSAPMPADFTNYSAACFDELPIASPLPTFALPNACFIDEWGVTVRYPSGWEVDEAFGPCLTYRPEGDDPESSPIMVGVDPAAMLDDIVTAYGEPVFTYDFVDRVIYGYLTDSPNGGLWVDYYTPLWPDVLDGPVVYVLTNSDTVPDVVRYADMMLKGLEITPYAP